MPVQVYRMLDELINGGEILEISKRAVYKYVAVFLFMLF